MKRATERCGLACGLSTLYSAEASLPSSGLEVARTLSLITESAPSTWVRGGGGGGLRTARKLGHTLHIITGCFNDPHSTIDINNAKQKRAEMLRHSCILGDSLTNGDEMRSGCLTPTFSGAPNRAKVLHHLCILRGPQRPNVQTKLEVAQGWAHRLQTCIFSKIGNFFFAVRSCNLFFAGNVCM